MFDIITVGSATVDAFAQTDSKSVKSAKHRLSYPSGAKILLSSLKFAVGGGGTNTGVAFSRLGLRTAYLGRMGQYANSSRVLHELKKEKVNTSLVVRGKGRTGYSIILDAKGTDRTILAFKGSNNNLAERDVKLSKLNTKWFYFSAMMGDAFKTQVKIAKYAEQKEIRVAFNPSSYLAAKGAKYLKPILSRTHVLILNKEEAKLLLGTRTDDVAKLCKGLMKLGPWIIAITQGKKGVYVADDTYVYFLKPRNIKVLETTGAGDAFSSGFVAGLVKGKDIELNMKMGAANAESVIQHYGAKDILLNARAMSKAIKKFGKVTKRKL